MLTLLFVACAATPVNLVPNSDFSADPTGWYLPAQVTLDTTVGHGDQRSLKLVNHDAAVYPLANLRVDAKPGLTYRFSAWVKTEGVVGEDTGATICLQSNGANGFLGGNYPGGKKGDNDWYKVEGEYTIPLDATSTAVSVYLRKGCTGTAWFDDVVVEAAPIEPLFAVLEQPNYRGRVPAGTPATAVLRYKVAEVPADGLAAAETALQAVLTRGPQQVEQWSLSPSTTITWARLPLPLLEPAGYELQLRLTKAADGVEVARWTTPLVGVAADAPQPTVAIDPQGYCLLNGQRHFPLGLYFSQVKAEDLATVAAGGFNTIMSYPVASGSEEQVGERLDAVQAAGLRIMLSIKDLYLNTQWAPETITSEEQADEEALRVVRRWRDHPALLGWYINDELPLTMHEALARRQRLVAEADPNHPTWAVLYQVEAIDRYADTADILGSDPYPIPDKKVALAGQWTAKTLAAKGPTSAVWQVPQIFDWVVYRTGEAAAKSRPPTLDEMRAMTYQCLAAGAKGLIFYSWFDLHKQPALYDQRWAEVKTVAAEVNSFIPYLLSNQTAPDYQLAPDDPDLVRAAAWQLGKETLVLVANGDTEPHQVTWAPPAGARWTVRAGTASVGETRIDVGPGQSVAFVVQGG